jgi:hypothetical protein
MRDGREPVEISNRESRSENFKNSDDYPCVGTALLRNVDPGPVV